MERLNCWQYKACGMGPGEGSVTCPAAEETRLHGVHGGVKGGRACWMVPGTLCDGKVQGIFARKFRDCVSCDFYLRVKEQEAGGYQMTIVLLSRLMEFGRR